MRSFRSIGIDIYQVLKWTLVAGLLLWGVEGTLCFVVVAYLIGSNLFSYFYYHTWEVDGADYSADRQRRRYLTLLLSTAFYIVCYAYLYRHVFADDIGWPDNQVDIVNALYLSVANAFTLTYGGFMPKSQLVRVVFATELVNSFFFLTVIISTSIPQPINDNEDEGSEFMLQ